MSHLAMLGASTSVAEAQPLPIALADIASMLSAAAMRMQALASSSDTSTVPSPSLLDIADAHLKFRRRRDRVFGDTPGIFGEPSWDILLDLFVREARNQSTSISSAMIGSASPGATALRHLAALQRAGLVTRVPDQFDRRRAFLHMTEYARARIDRLLAGQPY